ncbi:MAG: DUF2085 domain-containing protein [Cyanobacteria bacterium J06648_11]
MQTEWNESRVPAARTHWRQVLADVILGALIGGPLAAPFLRASSLPLTSLIADIIYFMGGHVCPQPEMAAALVPPHLMAVCMRCMGTLAGVVFTRALFARDRGNGPYWLPQYGLAGGLISVILMLFYPAEWYAQHLGWWDYSNLVVTPFGFVAGVGLGLAIVPLIYGSQEREQSSATVR